MGKVNIDKKKLYSQLFEIFEKELINIFEYIAPIEINKKTCGNRVHELLLRLGAEVENVAKEVCYDIAKDLGESTERIEQAQSKDFLGYLIDKVSINKKKLKFIGGIEEGIELITPFSISDWRDHYDDLKHGKIEKYSDCNLDDVIMAFGGYYILLNYMVLGYKYIGKCNGFSMMNSEKIDIIKSSIVSPTFAYHEQSFTLEINGYFGIVEESAVDSINESIKLSNKMIILDKDIKSYEECLFYVYGVISSFIIPGAVKQSILNKLPNIPKTYQLSPAFSFTNRGLNI